MTVTRIEVLLFAQAREIAGRSTIAVTLTVPASVAALRAALAQAHPDLAPLLPTCRFAIEQEFASDDALIAPGSEIALIPPVSGG